MYSSLPSISLRGTNVPGNIHSLEQKFPGTFTPGSESSPELSFLGAKDPSVNFRSRERKYRGEKSPWTAATLLTTRTLAWLWSLLKGFPWNWILAFWVKKWNGGANGPRQMFDDIFNPVDTIHEHDKRWRRTTMVGRRRMTWTAVGDKDNSGGLQTVTVDDVRWRQRRRWAAGMELSSGGLVADWYNFLSTCISVFVSELW